MIQIILKHNKGFKWYSNSDKTIYIKGFFFEGNNYIQGNEFVKVLETIQDKKDFVAFLELSNGQFSIIINLGDSCLIASDRIRTFPLFYLKKNQTIWISDSVDILIKNTGQITFSEKNAQEYLSLGYVLGNNTLFQDIFQIQAGEILFLDNNIIYNQFYSTYLTNSNKNESYTACKEQLKVIFPRVFQRLLNSCKGRQIIVPLSGGMDSRLIVLYLKELGAKNVICVTYGRKNNSEAQVSKEVAEKLGFKWIFVEYNAKLIKNFLSTEVFTEYYQYVAHYSSLFYFQEFFCVKYLKKCRLIDEDAISVPGFSGDMIGGSHLRKNITEKTDFHSLARDIVLKEFVYQNHTKKQFNYFIDKISKTFHSGYYAYSVYENWNVKERQAKFIQNSALVWDYFGYEYRTPFWDTELVDFFQHLPYKYKLYKRLYTEVLLELFTSNGLNLEIIHPFSSREIEIQYWKKRVKYHFPFLSKIQKFKVIEDSNCYKEITQYLIEDLHKKNKRIRIINNYNSVNIQWYIEKVREKN